MVRAPIRRTARAALISAALAAACGGPPATLTQPAPAPGTAPLTVPPFPDGQYIVTLSAPDFSSDPSAPACEGFPGVPPAGKIVSVELQVIRRGSEWIGRSVNPGDSLEFRFRDSGDGAFGFRRYSGTLRGHAGDGGLSLPPRDVEVLTGDDGAAEVTVTGENLFRFSMSTLRGSSEGPIVFRDSGGRTARCPVVGLHINTRSD